MARLTRQAKKHYPIRERALRLVRREREKNWLGEIARLHGYVRDSIRYVRDINGVETLATPEQTIRIGQGDCDDKSTLLAALLESVGHPARFVAVALRGADQFSHVYVETKAGRGWMTLETTMPWPSGMSVPGVTRRMVVHV